MKSISISKGLGIISILLVLSFFFISLSPVLRIMYHDAEPFRIANYQFPAEFDPILLDIKVSDIAPGEGGSFGVVLDLPYTGPKAVRERVFGLLYNDDGNIRSFSATCPHLNCAVRFEPEKTLEHQFWCNCHDGAFDPRTGEVTLGPPPRALDQFEIEIDGNDIYLISIGGGD